MSMSDSGEGEFVSMIHDDGQSGESTVSLGGMQQLLEQASIEDNNVDILKFSHEIVALTHRITELSKEKLHLEFENRELRSKSAPTEIELASVREEAKFLRNQVKEFWAEIETVSQQKTDIYKERCEIVRKLTDDIAAARTDLSAEKHRIELLQVELDRFRKQAMSTSAELRAKDDSVRVETLALEEKIDKQSKLIHALEKQSEVHEKLRETITSLENGLSSKSLEVIEANSALSDAQAEIASLKAEKEGLLQQLVVNKENRKAAATVELLLGRTSWNLSDLVDTLSSTKKEVINKRAELEELRVYVEEMREKEPAIEASRLALEQYKDEVDSVRLYNEQIKSEFEKQEEIIDKLKYEKMKIETELVSSKLRSSDFGKQLAALVHENESLRGRLGLHAGPGRTNPTLTSTPFDSDKKRPRSSVESMESPRPGMLVTHFRTVHDLVEQNMELKEKLDRLMNECETSAQEDLSRLRVQYEKIETANRELVSMKEKDRLDFDRTISRLEAELKSQQSQSDRLRKSIVGIAEMEIDDSVDDVREEFKRHLNSLNGELAEARTVCARTVGELDRVREELKRELEEKSYYLKMTEKVKSENEQLLVDSRSIRARLNTAELDRDTLSSKLEETKVQLSLHLKDKRDLEHQISNLKAAVEATERAYKELANEKETQSSVLVGYHARLEKESAMYSTNAEALKKLYNEELNKNKETLGFYQSAYEEQVRRCNELSQMAADLRADRDRLAKQVEFPVALAAPALTTPPESPSATAALMRDISRLETALKSAEEDIEKWREVARVNEDLAEQLRKEIDERGAADVDMDSFQESLAKAEATIVDLQAQIGFKEKQLVEAAESVRLVEAKYHDERLNREDDVGKLEESVRRAHVLEEQLRREKLIMTGKDTELVEQVQSLSGKVEGLERERVALDHRVTVLKAENEKYMQYFASDLSSPEKEEQGKLVLDQLQASLSSHLARENQLVADLQRSRSTLEVLLRENQSLKPIIQERDDLLVQRALDKEKLERVSLVEAERDRLAGLIESERASHISEIHQWKQLQIDLNACGDKIRLLESANGSLKQELEGAQRVAEQFKQLHAELSMRMAGGEELEQSRNDYAQLEKAKSQLTLTVSKLREEATKRTSELSSLQAELKQVQEQLVTREKDISRQDGLMKLKDKRITELEAATSTVTGTSSLATDEQVKQLMELINEYQAALAEATLSSRKPTAVSPAAGKRRGQLEKPAGDDPEVPEPTSEQAPSKRLRQSVYHDAAEEEDNMDDQ